MFRFDFFWITEHKSVTTEKKEVVGICFFLPLWRKYLVQTSSQRNLVTLIKNQIKTNFGFCFWNKILNEWKVFRAKLLNTWGLNYRKLIINLGCLKVTDIKKNNSCPKFKDTRSLFERKVSTQSPYFEYDFVQNTYLHILLQFEMISCYARHK